MTSILQVQATPNGELARLVQKRVSGMRTPDGGTVKVVEKAGEAVLAGMLAPDPHMEKGCPWQVKCPVADGKMCWTARTVYLLRCCLCDHQYVGTTGNSLHMRGQQHLAALLRGDTSYGITKHYLTSHPDWDRTSQPFTMEARGRGGIKGNIERYVKEAVAIGVEHREGKAMMNSKGEWGLTKLPRLGLTSNLA